MAKKIIGIIGLSRKVTAEQCAALRHIYPNDEVEFCAIQGFGIRPQDVAALFHCRIVFLTADQSAGLTFGNQPKEFDLLIWKNGRLERVTAIRAVSEEYRPASLIHPVVRTMADGSPVCAGDTSWKCSDGGRDDL